MSNQLILISLIGSYLPIYQCTRHIYHRRLQILQAFKHQFQPDKLARDTPLCTMQLNTLDSYIDFLKLKCNKIRIASSFPSVWSHYPDPANRSYVIISSLVFKISCALVRIVNLVEWSYTIVFKASYQRKFDFSVFLQC